MFSEDFLFFLNGPRDPLLKTYYAGRVHHIFKGLEMMNGGRTPGAHKTKRTVDAHLHSLRKERFA